MFFKKVQPVGVMVENVAIGARSLGFDSRAGQIEQCRQRLTIVATFLYCLGTKLRKWARNSLHAST